MAPREILGGKEKEGELDGQFRKKNKEIRSNLEKEPVRWVAKWCNSGILILTDNRRSERPQN